MTSKSLALALGGMESARFKLDEKTRLAEAADAYMRAR
jgi:hypothetical protein